jgi:translation elongation factor EF-4
MSCKRRLSTSTRKRMRQFGKVDIPQEAFIAASKVGV